MNPKFIVTIGVVAILLAVVGFVATSKKDKKVTIDEKAAFTSKEKFFPSLAGELNDVTKIELTEGKEKLTLNEKDDKWTLAESDDYEANEESVKNLLVDLGNIKKLEPKTTNSKLYSRLGVGDPSAEPKSEKKDDPESDKTEAKLVKLYDKSGAEKVSLLVGKDDYDSAEAGKGPNKFVRKPGDSQSWLVAGNIRLYVSKPNWVKADFLDIPAARVKSMEVAHKDGEKVEIVKADEKAGPYELKTIPEGREIKDQTAPSEASRALSGLRFDEVKKRESLKLNDQDSSATATIRTYDGLVFKTSVQPVGGKDYVTINVSADDAAIASVNDARKAEYEVEKKKAADAQAAQTPAPEASPAKEGETAAATPLATPAATPVPEPALVEADKIKKEADDLNAKLSPWAFAVPNYYRDRLMRRNAYFLKDLPKPGDAAKPAAPQPGDQPTGLPPGFDINSLMNQQGAPQQ